jgi:hypothetical protein
LAPPVVADVAVRPVAAAVLLLVRLLLSVQPLVPADLVALVARLPVLPHLPVLLVVKAQLPIPPHLVVEAQLLVLADLVVLVAAVPLQHLPSRQSFSAAMARSSPIPLPQTYKPGRSSR